MEQISSERLLYLEEVERFFLLCIKHKLHTWNMYDKVFSEHYKQEATLRKQREISTIFDGLQTILLKGIKYEGGCYFFNEASKEAAKDFINKTIKTLIEDE